MTSPAAKEPSPSYDDILARLASLHPKRIDLTLDRMWRILERLDHPERRIPPVIHVAGTNGKGSTVAFLRAILEAAGLRVHTYTSPHLVRFNERFRLGKVGGGVLVSDVQLRDALDHCERVNAGEPITIFEIETAAAFQLFAENPADIVLLEVGLGGRLDATNVIDAPLASVITSIGMDHIEFLGDTLAKIATEKAGIIKNGVPVICAEQQPDAEAAIEHAAKRLRAPLHAATQDWHVNVERGRLVYSDERGLLDLSAPRLFGRHQFDNAGLAIATLRAIESLKLEPSAFEQGIARAEWLARMQRLTSGTLVASAPRDAEIWLDGGHNPDAGAAIARHFADQRLHLIVGMLANKDPRAITAPLGERVASLQAVPVPGHEHHMAKAFGPSALATPDVAIALSALPDDGLPVLICGSLYLAGEVLRLNREIPH